MNSALGLRELKRQATRARIVEASLALFAAQGYEATTLDAVAAQAGISRRTFFHYFKSKEEILLSLQTGLGESLVAALQVSPEDTPMSALRDAVLRTASAYPQDQLVAIDRLMRASEAVQSRKQASYKQDELVVFRALERLYPGHDRLQLRLLAMVAVGAGRVALDAWSDEGRNGPLTNYLERYFDALGQLGLR
jgi:AcrR family transcriptional regulator